MYYYYNNRNELEKEKTIVRELQMDKRRDKINLMTINRNRDLFEAAFQYFFLLSPFGAPWFVVGGPAELGGP